jgi:hypothetical protein
MRGRGQILTYMHANARIACIRAAMDITTSISASDLVREHASEQYLAAARRRGDKTVSINVGMVHKALALNNRVPLVCAALSSKKFLAGNNLRLISKTGPSSGQSTTVTFTYDIEYSEKPTRGIDAFLALRGIGKEVFASLGGGEAFIRRERAEFSRAMKTRAAEGARGKR